MHRLIATTCLLVFAAEKGRNNLHEWKQRVTRSRGPALKPGPRAAEHSKSVVPD